MLTQPKILIGICSCGKYADKRQAVRETWLSPEAIRPCIEAKFFIGAGWDGPPEPDLVALPGPDDYAHLPLKVGDFYRYAVANHEFDYLLSNTSRRQTRFVSCARHFAC